jgi:hypothetical protein
MFSLISCWVFESSYRPYFIRIHFANREIIIVFLFCLFLVSYRFLSHFIYIFGLCYDSH